MSGIEWTDETWNPVIGCTPVSAGCLNCYAATMARRLEAMGRPEYGPRWVDGSEDAAGNTETIRIAEVRGGRAVFTGDVRAVGWRLADPLHWRKPRRIFVCSMSDLFHESVPFEFIDRVWAIMALCPQHTFQVLTKRPQRMAEYLAFSRTQVDRWARVRRQIRKLQGGDVDRPLGREYGWPLPNVWLGTSVEDQKAADERIPHLLRCPAAVRFLSCEPLLGPIVNQAGQRNWTDGVDWVIVGGESGPPARPCDVGWIRGVIGQCREAGVPVFVKQLGSFPFCDSATGNPADIATFKRRLADRKGGDPAEWPKDLRVREWPRVGGGA